MPTARRTAPEPGISRAQSSAASATAPRIARRREHPAPEHKLDPGRAGKHLDRLYRAAWAICGSPHEAEDLVQETYARVLSRPRLLRGEDHLGYLMRALRNTYFSSLRSRSARPRTVPVPEGVDLPARGNGGSPETAREAGEVLEAVAALPDDQRQVIAAVDLLGLDYGETARTLRVRPGTVKSRLFRARERVARGLAAERG